MKEVIAFGILVFGFLTLVGFCSHHELEMERQNLERTRIEKGYEIVIEKHGDTYFEVWRKKNDNTKWNTFRKRYRTLS